MIQPDWLERQAAARPRHAALVTEEGRTVDFATLARSVSSLRGVLASQAVSSPRVAVLMDGSAKAAEAFLACLGLGRPAVLIDTRLAFAEAARLVEQVAPGAVVGTTDTEDMTRSLARAVGAAAHVHGDGAGAPRGVSPARGIDPAAVAVVVFSSGTSGPPRPVELTAGNLLWSAMASAARLGACPGDRWLVCLPTSHVGGLSILVRAVLFGTTAILHRRFDVERVLHALSGEAVSLVSLVPTTLARILDASGARIDAPHLRCALIGGAGAPRALLERARDAGVPVAATYGLTEAASQVATLPPGEPLVESGHVGLPLGPTDVRILDDAGEVQSTGAIGAIAVRGPTVAPGACEADGWLHTGDLGRLDDAGALTVLGRRDDVIVTGGDNVSPDEVEAALARHPDVAEVAVAAVPDPQWGQAVGAWVVPRPGRRPTLESLRARARHELAPHELPRRLTLVDALPRTALGKVRRRRLAQGSRGS